MASNGEAGDGDLDWLSDYVISFLKSPTWVTPIAQFVDERCIIFGAEEENRLEYTTCHQDFKTLIDGLFAAHLVEVQVTQEQFDGFCQNGLGKRPQLHKILVEQLLSIEDFLTFKAMMVKRNADLYREVLRRMAEGREDANCLLQDRDFDTSFDLCETFGEGGEEEERAAKDLVSSEWQLYEDQLFKDLQPQEEELQLDVQRHCEQAELEEAIALSLQAEEERVRQLAAEDDALKEATAASMTAAAEAAPAAEPAATPALSAPARLAPLKSSLPRLMRVEPLGARPPPLPPTTATAQAAPTVAAGAGGRQAVEQRLSEVTLQRERAQRAMAMPASSSTAARPEPSEDERKARAEHLRRQRELLVAKRNQVRERKLQEFQQSRRGADAALGSSAQAVPGDAGKRLVAELAPSGAPATPIQDASSAAVQMRQALTVQLRETLSRTMACSAPALDDQISRLEQMKQR
mmetsp:Transcript_81900/g.244204  ORF Transcript_81900/g.244204 Transcript_81900/m.244204 type:complete len:464 (+) Transcript_81900:130-1521(+)